MRVTVTKMNGSGNDFVMIDNRDRELSLDGPQVAALCDRRRGVGADGLILLEPANGYDFFMRFFNADGSPAEMCGNGACCSSYFAAALGHGVASGEGTRIHFLTGSGPVEALVRGDRVSVRLMDARGMRRHVPVAVAPEGSDVHFMTVGTRHAIVPVVDAAAMTGDEVVRWGRTLRNDPTFAPQGANVNFASIAADGRVVLRTYEKGVEAETLACGTGSIAAAVLFAHEGRLAPPARILQRSGDELRAAFVLTDDGACDVVLEAPVAVNFVGTTDI
ncbi:MAG TPA: diaminopimelate epimerase [Candidatus Krumholzibacteria bacterium]|nr:diaminopimelate epimerase [Candidatus Krumholzibacteria bacterium]